MPTSAKVPRVLIVDDDVGLLILMADTLSAEGYQVDKAESAAATLTKLAEQPADLMLLDLKLRDLAGPALVERLQRVDPPVPFVVVTGQGDEKAAVEVMKQGALDYVVKNTALLDLLPEVVRRALAAIQQRRALAAAESDLRESVARFAAAVRATNDGVWEWRLRDNRLYFSDRWKDILGYQPDEIPDTFDSWLDRVHPEDRARLLKAQEACVAGELPSFGIEYRMQHKDRRYRWILCRGLLQRGEDGRPRRLTGAHTDITENKQLEHEILAISEREQRRIGQDLHDGLGQQLTAIELMSHTIKSELEAARPDLAEHLGLMSTYLREAIAQTRSLAHGLTAFMLDATGLQTALADLAARTTAVGRVRCRFECPSSVELGEHPDAAGHLYRIAQESVANALKHAEATEIVIRLAHSGSAVTLEISDDGRGLPRARRAGQGIGLRVMQHRANAIGADLDVRPGVPHGVTVRCTLRRRIDAAAKEPTS